MKHSHFRAFGLIAIGMSIGWAFPLSSTVLWVEITVGVLGLLVYLAWSGEKGYF